jgi:uncharacterized protein YgiM (DUF1202 family)
VLPKGSYIVITPSLSQDNFYAVYISDKIAYAYSKYINVIQKSQVHAINSDIYSGPIYSYPSSDSVVLGYNKGTVYAYALSYDSKWLAVVYNDKNGYVLNNKTINYGHTYYRIESKVNGLRVRASPSLKAPVVSNMKKGQGALALPLAFNRDWIFILTPSYSGFVHVGFIDFDYTLTYKPVFAIVDRLNFRSSPSLDGQIICQINNGEILFAAAESTSNKWAKAVYKGKIGYVYTDYISAYGNL